MRKQRKQERVGIVEAAKRLGLTHQALGQWAARPGAPIELRDGKRYCLWPTFPRWREFERDRALREKKQDPPADTKEARQRLLVAEVTMAEIDAARAEGKLIPVEDLEAVVAELGERLRAALINLPSNYQLDLERAGVAPEAAQEVLERIAEDLTRSLRETVAEMDEGDEGDGGVGPDPAPRGAKRLSLS